MNILNSPFVNWALQWAFSRSGVVVRWLVGLFIGWLAGKNIVPSGDVSQIQVSLTSGLSALVAVIYALIQFWLNKRATDGVNVVKDMISSTTKEPLKLNGVVSNQTVEAVARLTGKNAKHSIMMVRKKPT